MIDDRKCRLFCVIMSQQFTDGIISSFIFQSYLEAILYWCLLKQYSQLCILFVVFLITAKVDFRFQRTDIQRVSHAHLVLLNVLHKLTRSIGLERAEQRNTFLTVAFGGQIWNIQDAALSLMARSRRFITPPSIRASMRKSYQFRSCISR